MKLDGCTALITGASSGIGAATALELAAQGAKVAVVARRKDRLEQLAARITAAGGEVLVVEADLADENAAIGAVEQTVERFGRLDVLVNNAGLMLLGPTEQASTADWRRMVDLNVMGLLYCTHAALPHLVAAAAQGPREVSDLVNISSIGGRGTRPGSQVYNATKWGVVGLSESLRQELTAAKHVRVAVVEPGAVRTELAEPNRPEIRQQILNRLEPHEILQAEDVAEHIAYIVTRPRRVTVNESMIRPTDVV